MLMVLLVRGLTLPGAIHGITFYLYPDPTRLTDPQVEKKIFDKFILHAHLMHTVGTIFLSGMDGCREPDILLLWCLHRDSDSFRKL